MATKTNNVGNETRTAVDAILEAAGVTFSVLYRGEEQGTTGDKGRWCPTTRRYVVDAWSCTFTLRDGRAAFEEFDYFTGLGFRKPNESAMAKRSARSLAKVNKQMPAWKDHYTRYPNKPQAPHAADVLYSLILDSSSINQSFESWCDDFGYDSDSRKAESIYRTCQKNADKLARVFNTAQRDALADALQDY